MDVRQYNFICNKTVGANKYNINRTPKAEIHLTLKIILKIFHSVSFR